MKHKYNYNYNFSMLDANWNYMVNIILYKMLATAKYIGAGVACSGLIGAGKDWGTFLGSLILATAREIFSLKKHNKTNHKIKLIRTN